MQTLNMPTRTDTTPGAGDLFPEAETASDNESHPGVSLIWRVRTGRFRLREATQNDRSA
jgi:hypothetical protein